MIYKCPFGDFREYSEGNAVNGLFESPFQTSERLNRVLYVDGITSDSITFSEYKKLIFRIAALFRDDYSISQGDVVCLYAPNSIYTAGIHLGTIALAAIVSPASTMYNATELAHQIRMTRPRILITSDEGSQTAREAIRESSVSEIQIVTFSELLPKLRALVKAPSAAMAAPVEVDAAHYPAYYTFSSGTSGLPKGVITTHRNILTNILQQFFNHDTPYVANDHCVGAVLPMSHIFGLNTFIWAGIYRVHTIVVFPKFDLVTYLKTCSDYDVDVVTLVPPIALLFGKHPLLDSYPKLKQNLRYLRCGAAPLSVSTQALIKKRLPNCFILQGYGLTETSPSTHSGSQLETEHDSATVGWLLPGTEARLVDPETGEDSSRGELWVRGPQVTKGYLNDEKATKEAFSEGGWFKTGDVAVVDESGQFEIVDRIKELIKSKGHQVAPAELESVLLSHPNVLDAAVIGIPDENQTTEHPRAFLVLQPDTDIKEILKWFNEKVAQHKLLSGGVIAVDKVPKSSSGKILRRVLRDVSITPQEIKGAVPDGDREKLVYALKHEAEQKSILTTVIRASSGILGSIENLSGSSNFTEIGGDSLSALTFSNMLQEIYDISVPVASIISPTSDFQSLADYIEGQQSGKTGKPTYAKIHGRNVETVFPTDLALNKFVDSATLSRALSLPDVKGEPRTVLLTGATGFLGRHLALELLQRLATIGGKLICLIRAKTASEGFNRLYRSFDKGDPSLLTHFRDLATSNLEVVVGDKSEEQLGLENDTWQRLSRDVDMIVDSAAMVNHVLPYDQLFEPNVVGTAQLIRFAITSRLKQFVYVSTVAVGKGVSREKFTEDIDVRDMCPSRRIDNSYASGYGHSKWAGEVLLRQAHDQFRLPVSVFRCGMILANTTYSGQLNEQDMFTRLVLSLIATGKAPKSFYELDTEGMKQRTHYDGLPVDFVSKAICSLTLPREGYATYHVMNPHDDGIGLDEYVDWLIAFGYNIDRVDDYSDWLQQFENSLHDLPPWQQSASLLPLLHSYREPLQPTCGSITSTRRFWEALHQKKFTSDFESPYINQPLIGKYADDLQLLGLI